MNVERLKLFITMLLQIEKQQQIQSRLKELAQSLENFVGQPQDANLQKDLVHRLDALRQALNQAYLRFTPAQIVFLRETGAEPYFGPAITDQISSLISANPMTPVVVRDHVNAKMKERASFIANLTSIDQGLNAIGVKAIELSPGEAEIGFLIPRGLFDNNLEGLEKELHSIRHIINFFQEAITGHVEPVDVRQISSTDPLFFFGINVPTMAALGATVTWALDVWKRVLEIRKLHQQAKNAGITEQTQKAIESEIKIKVEASVNEKVTELLKNSPNGKERSNELEAGLKWALNSLLAQIERGLSVEIRVVPPAKSEENAAASEEDQKTGDSFSQLIEVSRHLEFPENIGHPILQLPGSEPEKLQPKR